MSGITEYLGLKALFFHLQLRSLYLCRIPCSHNIPGGLLLPSTSESHRSQQSTFRSAQRESCSQRAQGITGNIYREPAFTSPAKETITLLGHLQGSWSLLAHLLSQISNTERNRDLEAPNFTAAVLWWDKTGICSPKKVTWGTQAVTSTFHCCLMEAAGTEMGKPWEIIQMGLLQGQRLQIPTKPSFVNATS